LIVTAIALFISAIIGVSFLLAGKSKEETMDHSSDMAQDDGKFNSWVDKEAPDFTLTSYDGKKFNLKKHCLF